MVGFRGECKKRQQLVRAVFDRILWGNILNNVKDWRTYESTQYILSELVHGRKGFNGEKRKSNLGRATMERTLCKKNDSQSTRHLKWE